jgi:hypothetical protein
MRIVKITPEGATRMKSLRLLSLVALYLFVAPVVAAEKWSIADMNKVIDQTNFVVDDKCSGTLISLKEKLILTNDHCVQSRVSIVEEEVTDEDGAVTKRKREKFTDLPVVQNQYKGFALVGSATYQTEIVAHDKKRDLAILRFKQDSIPFTIASPLLPDGIDLVRGQKIYTVGNPAMFEATVVEGIVSSLTRQLAVGGDDKRDYIQVSGGVYGGNSGGALYDEYGRLIGVPAAGFQGGPTYMGFAIPIQSAKELLKQNCLASVWDAKADDAKCVADKAKKKEDKKASFYPDPQEGDISPAGDGGTFFQPTSMQAFWPALLRRSLVHLD